MRSPSRIPVPIIVPILIALAGACLPEPSGGSSGGGGVDTGDGDGEECVGPLGAPRDPATLPACCQDLQGSAHCLDDNIIPADLRGYVSPCTGGGLCVPDKIIETGGIFTPKGCASLSSEPGVCLSVCIPQVAEYLALLPQDVCDADERCTPCISPLDGMSTGACDLVGTCVDPAGDPGEGDPNAPPDDGDDPTTCIHEGDPVVDPAGLTPCAADAHCFDAALVPADFQARLAACPEAGKLCVPDIFLISGGDFIPASCRSVADAEGRCLSLALPDVTAQESLLPQATCAASERCVPCYSPLDQSDTGACSLSCDTGPTEPPAALPTCCESIGTCVPSSAVPADQQDRLGEDVCPEGAGLLCVPNELLDGSYDPPACEADLIGLLFGDEFSEGACLPGCLPDVDSVPFLTQGECDEGMKCAPCRNPLTGEDSGACNPI
jgi:hypothetical protein